LARTDRDGKSSALSIRINQILIHEIVGGHFEETNCQKSVFFSTLLKLKIEDSRLKIQDYE